MRFALRGSFQHVPLTFDASGASEQIQLRGCCEYPFVTLDQCVQTTASGGGGMSFLRGQSGAVGLTPVGVLT
jgi:hypothetical protein